MDPRRLEFLLAVMDHGQFNLAAETLGVTQQAVSKAISKLEQELRVRLFVRRAQGAVPTSYARALEPRARIMVTENRLATAELNALSGSISDTINLGCSQTFVARILPEAITKFRKICPNVAVHLTADVSENLYAKLLQGELDLVASVPAEEMQIDPGIKVETLFTEHDKVIVRKHHPIASRKSPSFTDLTKYPWVVSRKNDGRWATICRTFVSKGYEIPKNVVRTDSILMAQSLFLEHDYLTFMSMELMSKHIAAGQAVALNIEGLVRSRPAYLATRRHGIMSAVTKIMMPIILEVSGRTHRPEKMAGVPGRGRAEK